VPTSDARPILHTEASRGFGGQEIRILAEVRWLTSHGWRATIACQPGSRLLAEATAAGLPAVPIAMRGAADLRAAWALRGLLREQRVALVHTHSSVDSWLGALAARSLGLAVVRSRHVTIPILRRRALVYRLAHRVITSGEAVRALVAQAGVPLARIVAVPPGIDTSQFHPGVTGDRVRAELEITGPTVGLVANIRGSKGHDVFLEAARRVLAEIPSARFLIVGDGVGFEDVRRRVAELGLTRAVVMTGFRRDIPEVMAALDVLTLPSLRSEASSQVIPQALAVGTPVVASAIGGSPELIEPGVTGYLVPPGDAAALSAAIVATLKDPAHARAMARRGQASVSARFSMDAVMTRTTAVYEELLRR
jgi:glycosyltransferase involved in cell wall biosynthesis